jgi:hypothetical protein
MKRNIIITLIAILLFNISCTKSVDLDKAEICSAETKLYIIVDLPTRYSIAIEYIKHTIKIFNDYNDFIADTNEIAIDSIQTWQGSWYILYNGCEKTVATTHHEIVINNPEGTECWIKCIRTYNYCRGCQFHQPLELNYKKSLYVPDVPVFRILTAPEDWTCIDDFWCCD